MLRTIIRNLLKPLSFLPAILLMYMIFSFSAQDGVTSSQLSYKFSYEIIEVAGELLGADFEPWEIESLANRFHGPIRKIAHMTEYFALAVSVAFPLYVYGLRGFLLMIVAGLFCVGFACVDEYHQSMVAGRSPSKRDVMIDSIGIFFGIIFTRIIGWTGRKTIFRPLARRPKKGKKSKKNQQNFAEQMPNGYQNPPYMNYNGQPVPGYYQPQGYPNQQPYYNNQVPPGYSSQHGPSYYGPPPYDFPPQYQSRAEDNTSDQLSEDMSLRKLMTDLKEKKQTERHLARKPKLDKSTVNLDTDDWAAPSAEEDNDLEINEINLND